MEFDSLTSWPEFLTVVNGNKLPKLEYLSRVQWSDECDWLVTEPDFVLMNACDHGSDPDKMPHFSVRLEPGAYVVQRGSYGWDEGDPALVLFRFVRRTGELIARGIQCDFGHIAEQADQSVFKI